MNALGYANSAERVDNYSRYSRGDNRQRYGNRTSTCHKMLVRVRAEHRIDGTVRPLFFYAPNGRKIIVERLVSVRRGACAKTGDTGVRYEIKITCGETSQVLYLFDDDGVWFVERD